MVALLKRHLVCFYCGSRSAQKQNGAISRWQCENCEAVNYLDNEGNIMDPPASSPVAPVRFAHSISQAGAPSSNNNQDKILFCSTCIKNQQLLTKALAEYLPPFDDPQYPAFEASYEQYRRNLEAQFPQVCARCEPLVRSRIHAAGYAAKTDHLRRMIDRTKSSGKVQRSNTVWGWRDVVLAAGALGWWTSFGGQLLWNASGAFLESSSGDGLRSEEGDTRPLLFCAWQAWKEKDLSSRCVSGMSSLAGYSLLLNVASLWWNRCLKKKVHGAQGRMVGLDEYYKLQIVVLLARLIAWWALQSFNVNLNATGAVKGVHCFMLLFNLLMTIVSLRTVKMASLTPVFLHRSPERFRPEPTDISSSHFPDLQAPTQTNPHTSFTPFPVGQLGQPRSPRHHDHLETEITAPLLENDADAMDWTPSQEAFNPNPARRTSTQIAAPPAPSPFYGSLPAAPMSAAQKLRASNVPAQPSFKKTSPERQQSFFNSITKRSAEKEHGEDAPQTSQKKGQLEFAPPKFFPASDFSADTGLEGLFNAAFSLKDEPHEVATFRSQQERAQRQKESVNAKSPTQIFGCCVLAVSLFSWKLASIVPSAHLQLRLSSLAIAVGSAVRTFYQGLQGYRGRTSAADLGLSGIEFLCTLFLANTIITHQGHSEIVEIGGTILLGSMLLHGIWVLSSLQTAQPSLGASHIDEHDEQTIQQTPSQAQRQSHDSLENLLQETPHQDQDLTCSSLSSTSQAPDTFNDLETDSLASSSAFSSHDVTPVRYNQQPRGSHINSTPFDSLPNLQPQQQSFSPSPLLSSTTSARYGHYNQNNNLHGSGSATPHHIMTRSRAAKTRDEPGLAPSTGLQGLSGLSISSAASPSRQRNMEDLGGGFRGLGRAESPVRRDHLQQQELYPDFESDYYSDRGASPSPSIASTVSTAYPVSPYLGARDREVTTPSMTPGRMTRSSSRRAIGRF